MVLKSRLRSLDGWRAFAILCVLVGHFPYAQGGEFLWKYNVIVDQGDFGVRIFLVISGFIISALLISEQNSNQKISLRNFYVRRSLRIFPVYFAYLGTLVVLSLMGFYTDKATSWIGSLTFTRNVVGAGNSATVHFWSLAIEEQFYLLWPLTLTAIYTAIRLKRNRQFFSISLLILVVGLSCYLRTLNCGDKSFVCERILGARSLVFYMDALAIGCIAAILFFHGATKFADSAFVFWVAFSLIVGLRANMIDPIDSLKFLENTLEAFLFSICMLHTLNNRPLLIDFFLNNRIMVSLGIVSYSLYVWHFVFLSHFFQLDNTPVLYDWKFWWIPSLIIAYISYYFLEKPLLRIRKKFNGDLGTITQSTNPRPSPPSRP